jgi:hypothetical protein
MPTDHDIVTRLRGVFHNDRSVELMNRAAADEIERLRAERDEARRMVCALDADIMEDQMEYAIHREWDCFKEVKP